MITVTLIEGGKARRVEGRDPDSIARREFGKAVELRPEHDPAFEPETTTYMAVRTDGYGTHVLGRLVAPAQRGRGRPAIGSRVHVHVPKDLIEEIDQAAADRGTTRADEIRRRLAAG